MIEIVRLFLEGGLARPARAEQGLPVAAILAAFTAH
jgi:hypothetical protein